MTDIQWYTHGSIEDNANLILGQLSPVDYPYHHIQHTREVTDWALKLARISGIKDDDLHLLEISTRFHDTGFKDQYCENESLGVDYAMSYMDAMGYSSEDKEIVMEAQLYTNVKLMDRSPVGNPIAAYLSDADLHHIGMPWNYFEERNNNLRRESELHKDSMLHPIAGNDVLWYHGSYSFFKDYVFKTPEAREFFRQNKARNIRTLEMLAYGKDDPPLLL